MYCPLNNRVLFIVWRHTLVKGCALQKREKEIRREQKRREKKTKNRKEDNRPTYLSKVKVNGEDGMSTSLEKVVAIMVYPFVFATNVLFRNACNGT